MANTTVRGAQAIHGQNPQVVSASLHLRTTQLRLVPSRNGNPKSYLRIGLLEGTLFRINRQVQQVTLCDSSLFPRAAESLIDPAIKLRTIGGVYGNQKPTEFMCLLLKLLQIQPEKEILIEYLQADEFK